MNYFRFYDLPESFRPEQAEVKKKFYAFSKQYHPDFYVNDTPEKQQEILELSTLNNKAYDVLSQPRKRTEYLLSLRGLIDEKFRLPADFLGEMMELNEELMELEFEPDAAKIGALKSRVDEAAQTIGEELNRLFEAFDQEGEGAKAGILARIREQWYRQKYVLRLSDSFDKFAAL